MSKWKINFYWTRNRFVKKLTLLIFLTALVGCGQIFDTKLNCEKTPYTSLLALKDRSYIFGTSSMQIIKPNGSENYQCEVKPYEKNIIRCTVYTDYVHIYVFYNKLNGIISDERVRFDPDLSRNSNLDTEWKGICTKA